MALTVEDFERAVAFYGGALALGVADVEGVSDSLQESEAETVAALVTPPRSDRNQRLRAPDGLQLTLFQTGTD